MVTRITKNISLVAEHLKQGGIAAVPTETVYGLAANALNPEAVLKIYQTKRRPTFNPLIVHLNNTDDLGKYVSYVPKSAFKLMQKYSPGALTFVLKKKRTIPDIVTAVLDTVAIRFPKHRVMNSLIEQCRFPLCAPSANRFGKISPTTAHEVKQDLDVLIEFILDGGRSNLGIESTVVAFDRNVPVILRYGAVTQEQIESVCGKVKSTRNLTIISPGMIKDHYAPQTPLLLYEGNLSSLKELKWDITTLFLKRGQSLRDFSSELFTRLRKADRKNAEYIVAALVDNNGIGRAINDRLKKASSGFLVLEGGEFKIRKKS